MSQKISNTISKPKTSPKVPQRQKCYQDIIPPQTGQNPNTLAWYVAFLACGLSALPSLTRAFKDLPIPPLATRDNAPCCTSFACGLLALPSLTHTLKDLPLPPPGQQGMTRHTIPLLHVVFWPYGQQPHPYSQWFTRVIQSVSLQPGLSSQRQGNHTSHRQSNHTSQRRGNHQHQSTRTKPHQKLIS